jgi:hypothetical protein
MTAAFPEVSRHEINIRRWDEAADEDWSGRRSLWHRTRERLEPSPDHVRAHVSARRRCSWERVNDDYEQPHIRFLDGEGSERVKRERLPNRDGRRSDLSASDGEGEPA